MASYLRRREAAPLLLIMYFLIAVYGVPKGSAELYPFFNWSLFSSASANGHDVVLLVSAVDGQELDKPTPFFELAGTFSAATKRDIRLPKTLDRLAFAVDAGDEELESRLRSLVEATYLREGSRIEYQLAVIRYDPIERLQTGKIASTRVLRSYRKG